MDAAPWPALGLSLPSAQPVGFGLAPRKRPQADEQSGQATFADACPQADAVRRPPPEENEQSGQATCAHATEARRYDAHDCAESNPPMAVTPAPPALLVVDDEPELRGLLAEYFGRMVLPSARPATRRRRAS